MDLRREWVAWVVGERLGAVLPAERSEPIYMIVEGSRRRHREDSLSLDPEVLAPDAVLRLQDLQSLAYEFFAACERDLAACF